MNNIISLYCCCIAHAINRPSTNISSGQPVYNFELIYIEGSAGLVQSVSQ